MRPFRLGPARRSPSLPSPDGWIETQLEPASPPDGWAETRAQPASLDEAWAATRVDAAQAPDGWAETRAQTALSTKLFGDADDYLDANPQDIGRLTGEDVRELFVSCDPAEALQQQFDHLQPEFIAVHDIGTATSRRLLLGIAGATGRRVQRLVIRRQGFGTSLAALDFVDVPTKQGRLLRVYSTDADDADPEAKPALARTLLGCSRLAVVMVGDLPAAAMSAALQPLRDAMAFGGWQNRQMLLLPLAAPSALVAHGIALGQIGGVAVRTTPQVLRPADAWAFIAASWSRFGDPLAGADLRAAASSAQPAATAPVAYRAMPVVGRTPVPSADPTIELLERYLGRLADIAGMLSCCVFDVSTGRPLAHAGAGPDAAQLGLHGGELLSAMSVASRSLGLGRLTPDAAITLGAHHLLLRGVPNRPGLALHAILDKNTANLTLARMQLQRMDALFEGTAG